MDKLLPASLQILVLNRGMESVVYAEAIDGALSRVVCDAEVQSLLIACQSGAMAFKNFGISYYTSFSRGLDGDDRSGLERMDDVSFDFYNFAKEFKRCGIHFDYTIEVEHGHEHGKNDRHSLGLCSVFHTDTSILRGRRSACTNSTQVWQAGGARIQETSSEYVGRQYRVLSTRYRALRLFRQTRRTIRSFPK
jgi:hypothetical protein